ncbi:nitrate reductase [Aliikangiella coralliicola]|uniref:Nitrate reductase n=1 Tax=Aliikangiella coralliicola TaxID=2592383 RepID=A0A545U5Y4_9GAMM|nr:nitrate reductase [Aliikangiella coralliicola]TQV84880.1 nitrate reductase [Aliikangiella coralliicola]
MSKLSTSLNRTKTTCPYCGVGCGVEIACEENENYSVQGDQFHPANFGRLCTKGRLLPETLSNETRLSYPTVKGKRATWKKSIAYVANQLNQAIGKYGRDAVAFYVSGQLLTEDYYVANKLMKGFIGSSNIDTNSRLCMSSPVVAHKRAFGSDSVPVSYSDLESADLVVLVGSNLAWCHPVLYQRLRAEKQRRPQLKIVVIDPRVTASFEIADHHLTIKTGTDLLLFNGLLCYLFDKGYANTQFFTPNNIDATIEAARKNYLGIEPLANGINVSSGNLESFFQLFAKNEKVVTIFSQGINQSTQGVDQCNAIINCHLFTNRIGRPGMGPFSITGQPNAMGGREVGGMATVLAAHLNFDDREASRLLSEFWQTERLANKPGLTAVELFQQIERGKIKALWVMATNPIVSMPDSNRVKKVLEKCPLVVVSDCFKTSETLDYADVIFPAQAWGEKSGTVTNSERRISRQRQFRPAYQESKPDWWIISQVAKGMGFGKHFKYQNEFDIFKEHVALSNMAAGHTGSFELAALSNIDRQGYDNLVPLQWPQRDKNAIKLQSLKPFADGKFHTFDQRANMIPVFSVDRNSINREVNRGAMNSGQFEFVLNSGRVRDQWHTMTRSGLSPQLSLHSTEPRLLINPEDAALLKISDDEIVCVAAQSLTMGIRIKISSQVASGELFVPIHWSHANFSGGAINQLVDNSVDPLSKQPAFKQAKVTLSVIRVDAETKSSSKAEVPALDNLPTNRRPIRSEALLLCRLPLDRQLITGLDYWVKQKVSQGVLYHIASCVEPDELYTKLTGQLKKIGGKSKYWLNTRANGPNEFQSTVFDGDRLLWSMQISSRKSGIDDSWFTELLKAEVSPQLARALLSGNANKEIEQDKPLCLCMKVSKKQIESTIVGCGISDITKISELTGAGRACGSCMGDIAMMLHQRHLTLFS